jgi:hypothetical protein
VERAVGVRRRVVGGRRAGGPNGWSRARRNPDSGLPSGRGYYLTRRSFRRTDGR